MIYFICIIHLHIFHRNIWTQNWPAPNVSGFIAQLVEHRTGIVRPRVQAPLKFLIFFQVSLRNCKAHVIWNLPLLLSWPKTFTQLHNRKKPKQNFVIFVKLSEFKVLKFGCVKGLQKRSFEVLHIDSGQERDIRAMLIGGSIKESDNRRGYI